LSFGTHPSGEKATASYPSIGSIERFLPDMDDIVDSTAAIEVLGDGFVWAEGPLWVASDSLLLFTDVPQNKVFAWQASTGVRLWLTPSGYTGTGTAGDEPGANGLALLPSGELALCQHGDRRVAVLQAPLSAPVPVYRTLADQFQGERFNSPNDLCFDRQGNCYFTDPPYGLPGKMEDPDKQLPFQGVFRIDTAGQVTLLADTLTRPNGIALSPDGNTLYVANSDPENACWHAYDVAPDGTLRNGRIFHDATDQVGDRWKGLPDGLKVDAEGRIFATGPGGVWVFRPDGTPIGRFLTGVATANCALDTAGHTLYVTAHQYLCRVRLR
jgi:gluconolactonase